MVFGIFKRKAIVFTRKKAVKKTRATKKKLVKKIQKAKKPLKKKAAVKKTPAKRTPTAPALEIVGKVTHYFPHVKAGVVKLKRPLVIGDNIHILGHTTNFKQTITSMQINNLPIQQAKKGDEIGILVKRRVRHNDTVYRL